MQKRSQDRSKEVALLVGTLLIAISGLVYELLNSTLSSYLLGDSVYHFSLVIGLFMSAMGIGAWLSRYIEEDLERAFVRLQLAISLLGGFSALILFVAFAYIDNYDAFLYLVTISLGTMLGIEIPLIIRILKESFSLKSNISNVFTLDHIGALFASLLFPLVLVPKLGLMQTAFLFGMVNLFVAALAWWIFRKELGKIYPITILLILGILGSGFAYANQLTTTIENKLYRNDIIYSQRTPYQKIIVTATGGRIQFYINGAIQFDTADEYRYHEMLVHPAMQNASHHASVLIIGGGDGMALREVLTYPDTDNITLVDLDPAITTLFRTHPKLSSLNAHAFESPKVSVHNQDAWKYLESDKHLYDVVILDLPDPNNLSLSRLYSQSFYRLVTQHLSRGGVIVTQATSPLYTRRAFWSIAKSIEHTDLYTRAYHTYVPSFGEWGFVLAGRFPLHFDQMKLPDSLKYLTAETMKNALYFPPDMAELEVKANRLSSHHLIEYYQNGWERWYE